MHPDGKPMNKWLDGSASGPNGLDALSEALENQGLNQMVILSYPDTGSGAPVADSAEGPGRVFRAA